MKISTAPAPSRRPHPSLWKACATVLFSIQALAQAGTFYWTGDNNNRWDTSTGPGLTNWSSSADFNNGTPGIPGAADDAFFNLFGAGNLSTVLGTDFSIRSLTFTPDATQALTIGGANTLTLGTGGLTSNSPAAITMSTALTLGAAQIWTNNSAANPVSIGGVISGAAGLTLAGSGTFLMNAANTFSGPLSVFTGGTTLSGAAGSILNASALTLNAGTSLILDSTAANNSNRLSDTTAITTRGGTLFLNGNATSATTEILGTLNADSGASTVRVNGAGAMLTFGASGATPLASFNRTLGSTVNFVPGAGASIKAPTATLTNGILGGWAISGAAGTGVNFATTDGTGSIVPFSAYVPFSTGSLPADNAKFDASLGASVALTSNLEVNSLFLTGGSTPVNGVTPPNTTKTYYNGITFGTGTALDSTLKLTIGSGGIISSGATGVGHYNNKTDVPNMAFLGYLYDETGANTGQITTGAGVPDLIVYTESNLRIASNIVGAIGLTKSGPGLLDLSDGNTQNGKRAMAFTGNVTINEGTLLINAENNLGTQNLAAYLPNAITFNGGMLLTYAGTTFNTNRGITVGTRGGVFAYTGGGTSVITQKITGPGGFTIYARDNGGGGGEIINLNNTTAGRAHDYQGATNLWFSYRDGGTTLSGSIVFSAANQLPATSAVNVNMVDDTADHNVVANNLQATTATNLNLNSTAQSFGSLSGNFNFSNHNGALTLGANNLSTVYSGHFNPGTGSITKIGTGTQTLSGGNLYTGATNINGGALLIGSGTATTNPASSLANSTVTVGNGSLIGALGGNGILNGPVTVTSTGHLSPAMTASSFNTLTINHNLTLNSGSTLDFNFGAPGSGDQIAISGAGNLTLSIGADILNVTQLNGFSSGLYTLLNFGGTGAFAANATWTINGKTNFNYTVLNPGAAIDASLGAGFVAANQLVLQVLPGNPNLTWTGSIDANWDINTTANWAGDNTKFSTGANVSFDDTAARSSVTVVAGGVSANSIAFTNGGPSTGGKNYTFGGGPITVSSGAGITKTQAGTLTFNANVTTPITTLTGGSLTVGAGATYQSSAKFDANSGTSVQVNGTLTSAALTIKTGATLNVAAGASLGAGTGLTVDGSATLLIPAQTLTGLSGGASGTLTLTNTALTITGTSTFAGLITGPGSLLKTTGGTLTLSNGANAYPGGTTVSGGTLLVANATGSATGPGAVSILLNGSLGGTGTIAGAVDVAGHLTPGLGDIGTLNLGQGLSINTGTNLDFDIAALGSNDLITVGGALNFSGATTLNISALAGSSIGTYTLMTSVGALSNPFAITINHSGPGDLANFIYTTEIQSNALLLRVSAAATVWKGAVNNLWDYSTANWSNSPYKDSFQATFDDTGANPDINLPAPVAPFAVVFNNSSLNYSLSGSAIFGTTGLVKNGTGLVTLNAPNTFTGAITINGGAIVFSDDSQLGAVPAAATPGTLNLIGGRLSTNTTLTLNANRGIALGAAGGIEVGAGAILTSGGIVANSGATAGVLNKSGLGQLDLIVANTFSGGLKINAGTVRLAIAGAAGTGPITVNSTGLLALGADASNPVTLAGGNVGPAVANRTLSGVVTTTAGTVSTINTFDVIAGAGAFDVVLTNTLRGSGDILVQTTPTTTAPDGFGFRLRGTAVSDFSGKITVGAAAKFELQTTVAGPFSPAGTGKIYMTAGTMTGGLNGTYSIINLRNNFTGSSIFGTDIELVGPGFVNLNAIGTAPSGSVTQMGVLTIGDGQIVGVNRTDAIRLTLGFNSVILSGGNATFAPKTPNYGAAGINDLSLGVISGVAGAGFTMNGQAVLTLTAANTYSGPTILQNGTTRLGAAGALPATTALSVNGGTLDLNNLGVSFDQTVGSLSGSGISGSITNTDFITSRTLTVNQSTSTTYAGTFGSNIGLVKTGPGTLQLTGASFLYSGATQVKGGVLSVGTSLAQGSISGSAVTVDHAILRGYGSVGALTAGLSAEVQPGEGPGILTTGTLALQAGSKLSVELGKNFAGQPPVAGTDYDQIAATDSSFGASPTVTLGGSLNVSVASGLELNDIFTIILNNGADVVSGQFAGLPNGAIVVAANGNGFRISYFDDSSTPDFETAGGNDVSLQFIAVPEPRTWATLLSGVASLVGLQRIRRRWTA